MKEQKKLIIAEEITSDKGNKIWRVKVSGSRSKKETAFCKTPLAALRFCYLLKSKTGVQFAPDVIDFLCFMHHRQMQSYKKEEKVD